MKQKQFERCEDVGVLVFTVEHRLASAVFASGDVEHMLAMVERFMVGIKGTNEYRVTHLGLSFIEFLL